jgi:hypothetical protein
MLTILTTVALAGQVAVDVDAAVELGLPRLHDAFRDCQCVGMTWDADGSDYVLDLPAHDIARLERVEGEFQHTVAVVLHDERRIVLEEAPCVYAQQALEKYRDVLGVPVVVVTADGEEGEPTCGDVLGALRVWSEEARRLDHQNVRYMSTDDIPVASLQVLQKKGDATTVTGATRALAATRTRAASCWSGDAADSDATVQLTVKGSGGGAPRVKARHVGVQSIDRCFDELASAVAIPAGKVKVKAVFGPPTPPG